MRKLFSLCVLVVLISSSNGYGQSINKEAEEAFDKGYKAYKNKDFDSAVIYYTKAIEIKPNSAVYYYRGMCTAI